MPMAGLADYQRQAATGMLRVSDEDRDKDGDLVKVQIESECDVERDTVLAYRICREEPETAGVGFGLATDGQAMGSDR